MQGCVMRIGLVSYRSENRNIEFNMGQIELVMKRSACRINEPVYKTNDNYTKTC